MSGMCKTNIRGVLRMYKKIIIAFLLLFSITLTLYSCTSISSKNVIINDQKEIISTLNEIINTKDQTLELKDERINNNLNTISELTSGLNTIREQSIKTQMELVDTKQEVNTLQDKLQGFSAAIALKPTSKMVTDFIINDKTHTNKYVQYLYDCQDFSYDMVANALDNNIYGCVVTINFDNDTAHQIVSFNTQDKGVIYVEPQTNKIMTNIKVGDDYCSHANWDCEWYITKIKECW